MTRFTAKTAEAARKMAAAIMPNAQPEKKNGFVVGLGKSQNRFFADEVSGNSYCEAYADDCETLTHINFFNDCNDVVATIEIGESDTAIDEIRAQLGIENAAKVEVKKFEVGKWYYINSSPNCLPDYKVIRREKESVTLIDEDGYIVRKKIDPYSSDYIEEIHFGRVDLDTIDSYILSADYVCTDIDAIKEVERQLAYSLYEDEDCAEEAKKNGVKFLTVILNPYEDYTVFGNFENGIKVHGNKILDFFGDELATFDTPKNAEKVADELKSAFENGEKKRALSAHRRRRLKKMPCPSRKKLGGENKLLRSSAVNVVCYGRLFLHAGNRNNFRVSRAIRIFVLKPNIFKPARPACAIVDKRRINACDSVCKISRVRIDINIRVRLFDNASVRAVIININPRLSSTCHFISPPNQNSC